MPRQVQTKSPWRGREPFHVGDRLLMLLLMAGAMGALHNLQHSPGETLLRGPASAVSWASRLKNCWHHPRACREALFPEPEAPALPPGPAVADFPELFTSEYAETRLFRELPDTEPLARELRRLVEATRRKRHIHIDLDYVAKTNPAPPPLPVIFENFMVETRTPVIGEVFRANPVPPCISFRWSPLPVEGVKYIVEVAKARSFHFFRSFGAYTNHLQLRATKNADYFWRVRSTHQGKAQVSDISRFVVIVPEDKSPEAQKRKLATRIQQPEAWLADVQICP